MTLIFWIVGILFLLTIAYLVFMHHPQFGAMPSGKRLERVLRSPHYKEHEFQNLHDTPQLTEDTSMLKIAYRQLFKKVPRKRPGGVIPSVKTNLKDLPSGKNSLVWFGHSSYFMKIAGKNILVDPVFSGNASPVPGSMKSFPGTDIYTVDDLPEIDLLLITHDHYDHLDYKTILKLKPKVQKVICALGVGAHFEKWGYAAESITELDWYETAQPFPGYTLNAMPARHFSGRSFKRNSSVWQAYVFKASELNLFIGGDSGFDTHFSEIGKKYGPFDLAILENGQYDKRWRYIHALPEEQLEIAEALRTKCVLPVHSSKFPLASHPWDEPLVKITENFRDNAIRLVTPRIGELVYLDEFDQKFEQWWLKVD